MTKAKETVSKNKKAHQGHLFQNIKCVTGEVAPTYADYLRTNHWKGLRKQVAERDEYTCQRCYGVFRSDFRIHHNTYKYLGNERLKDLTLYCEKCHAIIHNDRKNTHAFNRSYNALIRQRMMRMDEEQIEKVLEFMDSLLEKPKPIKLTCRTCEAKNLINCQKCLNGKNLPFHTSRAG